MKTCISCKSEKTSALFYKDARCRDGLFSSCIDCQKIRSKRYNQENKGKVKKYAAEYQKTETYKKTLRESKRRNPKLYSLIQADRRLRIKVATPSWINKKQLKEISNLHNLVKSIQWLSDEKLSIDHIVPINGKDVCGLHVPWNLQIIPLSQNVSKGNKLIKYNQAEATVIMRNCDQVLEIKRV